MSAFATALVGARSSNRGSLAESGPGTGVLQSLGAIARYLPSEGIALYVAARSLLSPIDAFWPSWVGLGLAVALNVVIVATTYTKASTARGTFQKRRLRVQLASTVTLTITYVFALVGNPLDLVVDWPFTLLVTGLLALVAASVLPILAPRIGLREFEQSPRPGPG